MTSRRIVRFGPEDQLFGVLHSPASESEKGLVICAPFGEEAKCAYRTLYEFADSAADAGWNVFRFDYYGTGNSEGGFEEFCPARAYQDIRAAVAVLKSNNCSSVGVMGLGLGATLAFSCLGQETEDVLHYDPVAPDFMIMWQPILNGAEFYKLNIKRQLIRQMLTQGKAKGGQNRGDIIDLDGYPVRKATAEEIKNLNLQEHGLKIIPPMLIVQISYTQSLIPEIQTFADACHPAPTTLALLCEPFWKRIGFVECGEIYDATVNWMNSLAV